MSETREYPRKPVKTEGLISIGLDGRSGLTNLKARTEVKDISLSGFCLSFETLPGELNFTPARAHNLIGQSVTIRFSANQLTVWGEIVRFDAKAGEMAVLVARTSNNATWQSWCAEPVQPD